MNEEINIDIDILDRIKDIKNISISYIQRMFSVGFNKANKIYKELVELKYVNSDGTVNKKNIYVCLGEEYVPGLKLIFLDVDGVLNCSSTKDRCGQYIGIDDNKVTLLKEIVDTTNAKIVLVSSWKECWYKHYYLKERQDDMADYLDHKLYKQGLEIMDKTNDYNSYNRGDGILEYLWRLKRHNVEVDKYVILDDEMFDYKQTRLTKYLIRTSFNQHGLDKSHVRKAVSMLC